MKTAHLVAFLSLSITGAAIAAVPTTRPSSSTNRVEQLIGQLGAEDFKARAAAASELRKMGRAALASLKQTRHHDPEIESWCASLADQLEPKPRATVAQLPTSEVIMFRGVDGRIVREVRVGVPAIQRAANADLQRLMNRRLIEIDRNVELLRQADAEIRHLRKKLEEPIDLRLNLRRAEEAAKPAEAAPNFEPAAKW